MKIKDMVIEERVKELERIILLLERRLFKLEHSQQVYQPIMPYPAPQYTASIHIKNGIE